MADQLRGSGLIFLGYGGHDKGVTEALRTLPADALEFGVYWVNDFWPDGDFDKWLDSRDVRWVKHKDFDELMLFVHSDFELSQPNRKRFDALIETYRSTFENLTQTFAKGDDSEKNVALTAAADKAIGAFGDWWAVELRRSGRRCTLPLHQPETSDHIA